jgi:hypothetical protein
MRGFNSIVIIAKKEIMLSANLADRAVRLTILVKGTSARYYFYCSVQKIISWILNTPVTGLKM